MAPEKVKEALAAGAGKRFDPDAIKAMLLILASQDPE